MRQTRLHCMHYLRIETCHVAISQDLPHGCPRRTIKSLVTSRPPESHVLLVRTLPRDTSVRILMSSLWTMRRFYQCQNFFERTVYHFEGFGNSIPDRNALPKAVRRELGQEWTFKSVRGRFQAWPSCGAKPR